jgi:sulfatase modifying factor 1
MATRLTDAGVDKGMVLLPGGDFLMGADDPAGSDVDGERPVHPVRLDPFWISRTAVSNEEFERFVSASGYVTQAEQVGWSYVFVRQVQDRAMATRAVPGMTWWRKAHGAAWHHPFGPGSSVSGQLDHPVVHVSWHDALAFCRWAGVRLPSEAEWEYAARGGLVQKRYPWGDELTPDGLHRMNTWQGIFPMLNTAEDGYDGTCPVDVFPPNGYGLFNMAGNVWEWCADWFGARLQADGPRINPQGPAWGTHRVVRGGSYLCHESHSRGYRVSARAAVTPETSTGSLGFRCVRSVR